MGELPAGWAKPANATKWHYFPVSSIMSLCFRWMAGELGGRDDTNDGHKDNCVICQRKVKELRASALVSNS